MQQLLICTKNIRTVQRELFSAYIRKKNCKGKNNRISLSDIKQTHALPFSQSLDCLKTST